MKVVSIDISNLRLTKKVYRTCPSEMTTKPALPMQLSLITSRERAGTSGLQAIFGFDEPRPTTLKSVPLPLTTEIASNKDHVRTAQAISVRVGDYSVCVSPAILSVSISGMTKSFVQRN
jgi:hypothetical protein